MSEQSLLTTLARFPLPKSDDAAYKRNNNVIKNECVNYYKLLDDSNAISVGSISLRWTKKSSKDLKPIKIIE